MPVSRTRKFVTVIAGGLLAGALLGSWSSESPAAPAGGIAVAEAAVSYCGSGGCESMTWLRAPVMRRAAVAR